MAQNFALGLKVAVRNGEIVHGRDKYPLAGARATVDAGGALDKRVTATRLVLTGPLALGLRKKKDRRELFLSIEGDGFGFVVELDPKKEKAARQFAAKLNAVAGPSAVEPVSVATVPVPVAPVPVADPKASILDQIGRLADLRDRGVLTSDEFEAKKAQLLGRL